MRVSRILLEWTCSIVHIYVLESLFGRQAHKRHDVLCGKYYLITSRVRKQHGTSTELSRVPLTKCKMQVGLIFVNSTSGNFTADSSVIYLKEEFCSYPFEHFVPIGTPWLLTARVFQVNDVLIMTPIWWHYEKLIRTRTGLSNHRLDIYTCKGWPSCAWIIVYFCRTICAEKVLYSCYEIKIIPMYICDTIVTFWNGKLC